jgi:diketogulonate reductase-like aldo/keto reductase
MKRLRSKIKNVQQIVFRFAQQVGMIPLMGSRSVEHMESNLRGCDFDLSAAQIKVLENIAF